MNNSIEYKSWQSVYRAYSVGKNNIGAPKMEKKCGAFKMFMLPNFDSNIGLFSIAPCNVITLHLLFFIFWYQTLASILY